MSESDLELIFRRSRDNGVVYDSDDDNDDDYCDSDEEEDYDTEEEGEGEVKERMLRRRAAYKPEETSTLGRAFHQREK